MNTITAYRVLIWSEDPDKLADFYMNVLGMKQVLKYELPDDYGYALEAGESLALWIGKHGEIHGKAHEPFRHMINLYVANVQTCYEEIKDHPDVTIVQEPMITPPTRDLPESEQKHVCTFLDPDGNCLQFMER
jgi:catechol 2,3-dioxygenase-like lactoylglutathione lyase family enzyme